MATFKFQLRFRLPPSAFIVEDAQSILLTSLGENQEIILQSRSANSLTETIILDAIGVGFSSLDTAIFHGRKTRDVITVCCALLTKGVEIGRHEEFFDQIHVQKAETSDQTYIQPDNVDGLLVYPEAAKIEYVSAKISMRTGPHGKEFQQVFSKYFSLTRNLDKRLILAFELYNSHRFDLSLRSSFLQLITVVECLAERKQRKSIIIEHIKTLIATSQQQLNARDDISEEEVKYFIQQLHNLKSESISSACRNMIQKQLGDEDAVRFHKCYVVRGKLIHDGTTPTETELVGYYHKLERITRRLLHSIVSQQEDVSANTVQN